MAVGVIILSARGRNSEPALAAGLASIGLGAVVGPSVGHIYAGEGLHAFALIGGRLLAFGASAALVTAGVFMAADDQQAPGAVVAAFGAASGCVGLGLMIWDLVDAPSAAERDNESTALPRVDVGPTGARAEWRF
jgi:hypothetical protein